MSEGAVGSLRHILQTTCFISLQISKTILVQIIVQITAVYLDFEPAASTTSGVSKMASFKPSAWKEAMLSVKSQFLIDMLLPEQEDAIRAFMEKGNLFVNLPTGFGKSLIFQCVPFVADILYSRSCCSSVMVVISPLKALVNDQVEYLGNLGIPVINIHGEKDPEIIQQVKTGTYILV